MIVKSIIAPNESFYSHEDLSKLIMFSSWLSILMPFVSESVSFQTVQHTPTIFHCVVGTFGSVLMHDNLYVSLAQLYFNTCTYFNNTSVKWTLEISGESGLGKSTLINSLFLTDLYSAEYQGPSHRIQKTVKVLTHTKSRQLVLLAIWIDTYCKVKIPCI